MLGHQRRHVRVHGPGQRVVCVGAELAPGHEDHVGARRQRGDGGAVEQVAGDGLDAVRFERFAHAGFAEAGDGDHAATGHGVLREAGQRRAHLAAHAEDHQVAVEAGHVAHEVARGRGQVVFKRGFALEALGKGQVVEDRRGGHWILASWVMKRRSSRSTSR
ncbi:hypothetical protein D9M69_617720 [compost metagenome]